MLAKSQITLIITTAINRTGKHYATMETLVLGSLGGILITVGDRAVCEKPKEGSVRDHLLSFTAPVSK